MRLVGDGGEGSATGAHNREMTHIMRQFRGSSVSRAGHGALVIRANLSYSRQLRTIRVNWHVKVAREGSSVGRV